ncbi:hypothetical protein [Haloarcula nitratireducens]|uniref:hypothetical protein n=1 Tax=Haloarcula nitratireducens TaxID=2487749 RepID=UPI001F41C931|nr:hypothetical protein [Halomicroarcula nitratireducens]
MEGTPDLYRRAIKGIGFALGILGEDSDDYGHCSAAEIRTLVDKANLSTDVDRALGSPLTPLAIRTHDLLAHLGELVNRTQLVRWWTLHVARVIERNRPSSASIATEAAQRWSCKRVKTPLT